MRSIWMSEEELRQYLFDSGPQTEEKIRNFIKENRLFLGVGKTVRGALINYEATGFVFDPETLTYNLSEEKRKIMAEQQASKGAER